MGRISETIWRPLPENQTQPKIVPTQWILHTAVDGPGPTNLGDYFERADITLESHTWLRWDRHEQLLDTEIRGDANYKANKRPDGTGAISTETEDDGTPVDLPWNVYQVNELIRVGVELNRMHGIPAKLCTTPDEPGMGYHSLFPMVWTNVAGKTCPGLTRINQFKNTILPGIVARISGNILLAVEEDMPKLYSIDGTTHPDSGSDWLVIGQIHWQVPTTAYYDELVADLGVEHISAATWDCIKAVTFRDKEGLVQAIVDKMIASGMGGGTGTFDTTPILTAIGGTPNATVEAFKARL